MIQCGFPLSDITADFQLWAFNANETPKSISKQTDRIKFRSGVILAAVFCSLRNAFGKKSGRMVDLGARMDSLPEISRAVFYFVLGGLGSVRAFFYIKVAPISARSLRSPLDKVTCAVMACPFNRSRVKTKPFDWLST